MLFAERNGLLINPSVATIRNDGFGVVQLAIRSPHLARSANRGGHGSINNDITGHMQIGDSLVGIDHGKFGSLRVDGVNIGLNGALLIRRKCCDLIFQCSESIVGFDAQLFERGGMLLEEFLEEHADNMPKDDRVGNLHHRCFQMHGQQHILQARVFDFARQEFTQRGFAHHRSIDHFASLQRNLILQHGDVAILPSQFDANFSSLGHDM